MIHFGFGVDLMKIKSLIFLCGLFYCCSVPAEEYTVGVVPQFEARRLYSIWKPILQLLEQKTGHRFRMIGAESIPEFEKAFSAGRYDFAYMNPWHALVAYDKQGYLPIVRDSIRQLKGILVVHKDSAIKDVSQLQGKIVAFPAPNALGASLLMRAELKRLHDVKVNPVYVGTHSSSYLNVAFKQAAAAGGVVRTFYKQEPIVQSLLNIIYETAAIAPHPFCVHPRVSELVRDQVSEVFLAMKHNPQQQAYLAEIPMQHPTAASLDDYQSLKQLGLEHFYVKH